jgi:dCTP diphosphatase
MSEFKNLTDKLVSFSQERDWEQFLKPKDLAISLSLEANEVLEHFQWKNESEVEDYVKNNKERIGDELADVLLYLLQMAHYSGINLLEAAEKKLVKNALKYPIEKAKGNHKKYTEF